MKLFVGLGNPGKEYEKTRHNAGFMLIDYIANLKGVSFTSKFSSLFAEFSDPEGEKVILLKPQTYMNESGKAVQEAMKFYKIGHENVYIAFDDLDIQFGEFKIQKAKYPKIHNGVNDIIKKTGTDQFTFVRIGTDDRSPIERQFIQGRDYVLQKTSVNFSEILKRIATELAARGMI